MSEKRVVVVCGNVLPEVSEICRLPGFENIEIIGCWADCASKKIRWSDLKGGKEGLERGDRTIFVLPVECDPTFVHEDGRQIVGGYVRFSGPRGLFLDGGADEEKAGVLTITPGWLRKREEGGRRNKIDAALVHEREGGIDEVIMLQTVHDPQDAVRLNEFASSISAEYRTVPITLLHLENVLSKVLNEPGIEGPSIGKSVAGSLVRVQADYAIALSLLAELSQAREEEAVISSMLEMFALLFSPEEIRFLLIKDGAPTRFYMHPKGREGVGQEEFLSRFKGEWSWAPTSSGFLLKIESKGTIYGLLEVKGLAFPKYKEQYINLSLMLIGVIAMALSNAKAFQKVKGSEEWIRKRLDLEHLISELASGLVADDDLDSAIEGSLAKVGMFTSSDRTSIYLASEDRSMFRGAAFWCREGVDLCEEADRAIPISILPWSSSILETDGQLIINDVSGLPPEAITERSMFEKAGTRSAMLTTLTARDGAIGILMTERLKESSPWTDESITLAKMFGEILSDALERRRAEHRIMQLNQTLSITNRIMRHDIKNELAIVHGYIELYMMTKNTKHLDRSISSIDHLVSVIEQMKELDTLLMSGKGLSPYHLADIAREIAINHGIGFTVAGDAVVQADQSLASVIDNIVSNAIGHGKATTVDFAIDVKGSSVTMRIWNNGSSIPDEVVPKLFEEGFSFGEPKGSGLGLFLVRRTMERYQGRVEVEGSLENGAAFLLTFPRSSRVRPGRDHE